MTPLILVAALMSAAGQSVPSGAHCTLRGTATSLTGACSELAGGKPSLTLAQAPSLATGRYRRDADPVAIFAGQMRVPAAVVPVELELYADGSGILRPEGLVWLVVIRSKRAADSLEFDLDPAKTVPPSDLDRQIVARAAAILSSEAVWDRADDRECGPDDTTWSIYCAMIRATREVTGGIHHRRPAMEVVRRIVDERSKGRQYEHRLRDYNNDRSTTLADVKSLFAEALARMKTPGIPFEVLR